jgi:hypothetical protein
LVYFNLFFEVPPKIANNGPLYKKVIVGDSVELPCNASGTPKPRIIWQKGTSILAGAHGTPISMYQNVLLTINLAASLCSLCFISMHTKDDQLEILTEMKQITLLCMRSRGRMNLQ